MTSHIFLYGTLVPGGVNHFRLENEPGQWKVATTRGKLVYQGWGAEHGCPGIIPDDQADIVEGYVFSSPNMPAILAMLDELEGEDYQRVLIQASLTPDEQVEAWVYALNSA